jgi:5-methylcytosine-specific restriction endonuclease McrA
MKNSRPICIKCNKNLAKTTGSPKADGSRYYQKYCMGCINEKNHGRRRGVRKPWQRDASTQYKKHKKPFCEECGFVAKHPCQLDVDHIDSDHKNNSVSNLKTLCANCHRLKTQEKNEYLSLEWRHKELETKNG